MEWFKMESRYYDDPAVVAAGEKAEILFLRGIAYATDFETFGFIPTYQLTRFGLSGAKARADALVRADLWAVVEGGWQIKSYERIQAEIMTILRRRKADRDRKRAERSSRQSSGVSADVSTDKSPDSPRRVHEIVSLSHGYESLGQVETENKNSLVPSDASDTTPDNPSPPQAAGPLEEPSGHDGQHLNCRACGTNQRRRATNPRALHVLAELPPRYCGQCHETYPVRKGADGRYLECPTCHPEANTA